MIGAGLLAKKAVGSAGSPAAPWVKTALAPGSRVVTDYLDRAGLCPTLEQLGFQTVGLRLHHLYRQQRPAARDGDRQGHRRALTGDRGGAVAATGTSRPGSTRRCGPTTSMSPMLVVAFALAGRVDSDITTRAARHRQRRRAGLPRATSGPRRRRSRDTMAMALRPDLFRNAVRLGVRRRRAVAGARGARGLALRLGHRSAPTSQEPPFFPDLGAEPRGPARTSPARGFSRCSATRSPPITSRRPARSPRTGPPRGTCASTASSSPTGTPSAPAAAITR